MARWRAPELIAAKRDGQELEPAALAWLVDGYVQTLTSGGGDVSEGQMGAFLMAGVLKGFTEAEALALTRILVDSGETLDLTGLGEPTIDKHSTGGVGDSTTLLVGPLLASAGATMVKLSGRGLGHTGGTLDKLESIPGFRTGLDPAELRGIAESVGCVVAAQSDRLVPADRALYALRDVTATVPSTALIASSVMSKKLASGAGTILLDVKAGHGAFMPTAEDAAVLAQLCVGIGVNAGRRCAALVTAMDEPLGHAIGNALDIAECVEALREPPAGRLSELALDLAATALALARDGGLDAVGGVRGELIGRWEAGEPLERLARMIDAQGGDPTVCDDPRRVLPVAPITQEVRAARAGYVAALPARSIGEIAMALGAGRVHSDAGVDPAVGLELTVELGDQVDADTTIARVHARSTDDADRASARLQDLLTVSDQPVSVPPTLLRTIS